MNRAKEVKCMKKSDLVAGKHVVKYRDGGFRFVGHSDELIDGDGHYMHGLRYYDERLNDLNAGGKMDIVAVYELKEVWKREEPTITEDEKTILRNLPGKYEWIARNENSTLFIYQDKPRKRTDTWRSERDYRLFNLFNHLFKMVKWEDDEPWKIEDLLKLDVKEDK